MAIKVSEIYGLENFIKFIIKHRQKNSTVHNSKNKHNDINAMVSELSSKITVLSDKIIQLTGKVMELTISHEEILYSLEQVEQIEKNHTKSIVQTIEKKYEIN